MQKYNPIHTTAKWPEMRALFENKTKSTHDVWPFEQQTDQAGKLTNEYKIVAGQRKSIKKANGITYILCIFKGTKKNHLQWVRLSKVIKDLNKHAQQQAIDAIIGVATGD